MALHTGNWSVNPTRGEWMTIMVSRHTAQVTVALCFAILIGLSACANQGAAPTATPGAASAPTGTPRATRPTRQIPTRRVGPTITPSGPLFSKERPDIQKLLATAPNTVGGFAFTVPGQNYDNPVQLVFKNVDGAVYGILLYFEASAEEADYAYNFYLPFLPNGQAVPIGDAAIIAPQGRTFVALMRYRNLFLEILPADMALVRSTATPVALSTDQLVAVLTDLRDKVFGK
jgi:hypothetical protein